MRDVTETTVNGLVSKVWKQRFECERGFSHSAACHIHSCSEVGQEAWANFRGTAL